MYIITALDSSLYQQLLKAIADQVNPPNTKSLISTDVIRQKNHVGKKDKDSRQHNGASGVNTHPITPTNGYSHLIHMT